MVVVVVVVVPGCEALVTGQSRQVKHEGLALVAETALEGEAIGVMDLQLFPVLLLDSKQK